MISILSLDGGGIRALLTLQILKYLEKHTGKRVSDLFDYIAGTSTGAILAVGLTSPRRLGAVDLEQLYLREAANIFDSRWVSLGGLTGPKYHMAGLERALQATLGGGTLSEALVPTLAMAYDLEARLPVMLTSYGVNKNIAAWQAARASSAAPTFFAPWHNLVDGGLVANNPALTAAIEASKLYGCSVSDCRVLSLGTGATEAPIAASDAAGWGKLGWVEPVISVALDGASDLADLQLSHLLPEGRYLRLQCRLAGSVAEMDNVAPANLLALQRLGTQLVGGNLAILDAFAARLGSTL